MGPCKCQPFVGCGITDSFHRIEPTGGGISDAGIAWVEINGNDPDPSGLSYNVDGFGLVITADDVAEEFGSIDLPLPASVRQFEVRVRVSDYPASFQAWLNFQTPPDGLIYVALDAAGGEIEVVDFGGSDAKPFDFDGSPFFLKARFGDWGIRVKWWYQGDPEPGWFLNVPDGGTHGDLPLAISLEGDGLENNGDSIKFSDLRVTTAFDPCAFESWEDAWAFSTTQPDSGAWSFGDNFATFQTSYVAGSEIRSNTSLTLEVEPANPAHAGLKDTGRFSMPFSMTVPDDTVDNSSVAVAFTVQWKINGYFIATARVDWDAGTASFYTTYELSWGSGGTSGQVDVVTPANLIANLGTFHTMAVQFFGPDGDDLRLLIDGAIVLSSTDDLGEPQPDSNPSDVVDNFDIGIVVVTDSAIAALSTEKTVSVGLIDADGSGSRSWCSVGQAVNRCYVDCLLPIFDDFGRTVADPSWGSASSGPAYSLGAGPNNGMAYVNPGAGVFQNGPGASAIFEAMEVDLGITPGSDFEVRISAGLSSDTDIDDLGFVLDEGSVICGWGHSGSDAIIYLQPGGGAPVEVAFPDNFWATVDNVATFAVRRFQGAIYFKLFDTDSPEPGWQVAITDTGSHTPGPDQLLAGFVYSSDDVGKQQIAITEIRVGDPCADPVGTPAAYQPVQDELAGIGDGAETVFTTAHSYLPGSLEVDVGGLRVPADNTDPAVGTFTLLVAAGSGAQVRASYRGSA